MQGWSDEVEPSTKRLWQPFTFDAPLRSYGQHVKQQTATIKWQDKQMTRSKNTVDSWSPHGLWAAVQIPTLYQLSSLQQL